MSFQSKNNILFGTWNAKNSKIHCKKLYGSFPESFSSIRWKLPKLEQYCVVFTILARTNFRTFYFFRWTKFCTFRPEPILYFRPEPISYFFARSQFRTFSPGANLVLFRPEQISYFFAWSQSRTFSPGANFVLFAYLLSCT